MDFFDHQDRARRKTSRLVTYYVLAVVLITVAIYVAFMALFIGVKLKTGQPIASKLAVFWNPRVFLGVIGVTLMIVVVGTLYKVRELSAGGEAVARLLGGRPVNPSTRDAAERRVLNVVEEMAIASGTPVPRVFVLPQEESINAFAAGFSSNDAVIGVTRGCVQNLSRDELQGVIAHEFSHILNGDMRINIRLMGVLHGILVVGIIGYWLMRSAAAGGRSRSRDSKGGGAALLIFGLVVMAVGFVGVFFGKLIKAAISRQREFLADASAVQFTRNPLGIAGALKKIAGLATGSRIRDRHAEEASHLFFADGLRSSLLGLLATHPPLQERIRRIDPAFDGGLAKVASAVARETGAAAAVPGLAAAAPAPAPPPLPAQFAVQPGEVVARVGAPQAEHLAYAIHLVSALPAGVTEAAREPFGARAVVYCLLLNREPAARKIQLDRLTQHADPPVLAETRRIMARVEALGPESRLPLLDMALSSLRELSRVQYQHFSENVRHLVEADKQIDLFEFTLRRMVRRRLQPIFEKTGPPATQVYSMKPLLPHCVAVLSALAHWGNADTPSAESAFAKGVKRLQATILLRMVPREKCGLQSLDAALEQLAAASPAIKRRVIDACATCIGADGKVTVEEAELLRAVADSLDCPVPPFVAGQAA